MLALLPMLLSEPTCMHEICEATSLHESCQDIEEQLTVMNLSCVVK